MIGYHLRSNSAFSKFSRCLPFSKWLPKHGIKKSTGRNLSMSGNNSGHHNLPTYEISVKSNNVEFVRYCGGHFLRSNSAFSKFSRCLPFSKWLPKHGIKKSAVKIQHCPISSKFDMWVDNDGNSVQ
jgi:hypothetical protein